MHPDAVRALPTLLLGLAVLAVGHVAVYLVLSGEAREALDGLERRFELAELEGAQKPSMAPPAGSEDYSPWLRSYERWHASGEYGMHARQEGLVRGGMIVSFLIGLGLLGHGFYGLMRTPRRRYLDRPARERLRPVPARAPSRAGRPAAARRAAPAARRLRKSA